jgi:hypothetical protein
VRDSIVTDDPLVLGALCLPADLARVQFGRNILSDLPTDPLQEAAKPSSFLLIHNVPPKGATEPVADWNSLPESTNPQRAKSKHRCYDWGI